MAYFIPLPHAIKKISLYSLIRSLRRRINNIPLLQKILLIVMNNVFLILIFFLLGLRLCMSAYNELLYQTTAGNLTYSAYTVSDRLKNIESVSSALIAAPEIQSSLSQIDALEDSAVWANARRIINNSLQTYYTSVAGKGASFLMIQNSRFSNSTYTLWQSKLSSQRLEAAIKAAQAKKGAVAWTPGDPGSNALLMSREIRKVENMDLRYLGTLIVYVDLAHIVEKANAAVTQYTDSQYLISMDGTPLYSPAAFSGEELLSITDVSSPYQTLRLNSHTYFTIHSGIPGYPMEYYGLVSYDEILRPLRASLTAVALVLLAGVLLAAISSYCFIHSILKHFNILVHKMEMFSRDEAALLSTKYDSGYAFRKDEIGRLHQGFERMTHRIQHLVNTSYVNKLLAREAQIKALESQINPHFLYNTLESINWRAKAVNNQEISLMTEALGSLLRATLSNRKSLVTLSYERNLIHSYITIQQIRFEERLDFSDTVPEDLGQALIPPLTLQPLVENAIHYALEEITETCYIMVSACLLPCMDGEEPRLCITVKNSGSCFDDNLLELLRTRQKKPSRSGIGLLNIDKRIKLLFGDAYGLFLCNEEGSAVAAITIPYRTEVSASC